MSVRSVFLSTLSLRRATPPSPPKARVLKNFYPRSPCGERQANRCTTIPYFNFYPRSPCGERRFRCWPVPRNRNFYPRSPCGERLDDLQVPETVSKISIHALLAESDLFGRPQRQFYHISIHALLAESDNSVFFVGDVLCTFLSTLSLRRAT